MADKEEKKIIVPRFEKAHGYYTTSARSNLMSKIKGKNTKPELLLRSALWKLGIRYRLHNKKLPGNPDIANKKCKMAIFVDGEFWHGFEWEKKKLKIGANRDFWIPKIERNMQRDHENNNKLAGMGYKVFRFWEKTLYKELDKCVDEIITYLKKCN
jgi:DNA mismatch endonuclease (patch repair protein)